MSSQNIYLFSGTLLVNSFLGSWFSLNTTILQISEILPSSHHQSVCQQWTSIHWKQMNITLTNSTALDVGSWEHSTHSSVPLYSIQAGCWQEDLQCALLSFFSYEAGSQQVVYSCQLLHASPLPSRAFCPKPCFSKPPLSGPMQDILMVSTCPELPICLWRLP